MTIASVQEYITTTSTLPTTRSRRENKLNLQTRCTVSVYCSAVIQFRSIIQ